MILLYVVVCIVAIRVWYLYKNKSYLQLGTKLPGPVGYPLIGNVLVFLGKPQTFFVKLRDLVKNYERMTALWIGPRLQIFVYNAADIELILQVANDKSEEYEYLKPWLGESLLTGSGLKYRLHKKLILPSFTTHNLLSYFEIFNKNSRKFVTALEQFNGKGEFDINKLLSITALNTILDTSLGITTDSLQDQTTAFIESIETLGNVAHLRTYKYWLRPDWIFKFSELKKKQDCCLRIVNSITETVIANRKLSNHEIPVGDKGESKLFLDNMISAKDEMGDGLSSEEIRDEVMTIMFAGQDTTTVTVGFVLSLLGIFTDVQAKVLDEINDIFGSDESLQDVTYENLKRLKYLEQVIQETWRLYPPVPVVARKTTQNIALDGYIIPKDSTIAILIMYLHRNPLYFKNPHNFNPDNFSPENIKSRHNFSFIPFSAGYRTCIGRKYSTFFIKILLVHLLKTYNISSSRKENEFRLTGQITLKRKDGFLISIQNR